MSRGRVDHCNSDPARTASTLIGFLTATSGLNKDGVYLRIRQHLPAGGLSRTYGLPALLLV